MSSETVDWKGRPAQLRRAVHVTFLDGQLPTTEIMVLDDDAPSGGRRVQYVEVAEPQWEIRAWHEGDGDWSQR